MQPLVCESTTRAREQSFAHEALRERAGQAVWRTVLARWPSAMHLLIAAGHGNNGGDARIVVALARASGRTVTLIEPGDESRALPAADLIIDGWVGLGLKGALRDSSENLVQMVNAHEAPVLAIDVPSGVNADTGAVERTAVRADMTLQLLDRHRGLYTGDALDHVGELLFDDLGQVPPAAPEARLGTMLDARVHMPPRRLNSHKGLFGHVCVVGGNSGMAGAGVLAASAALRAGAGKVTWLTRAEHARDAWLAFPELMTANADDPGEIARALDAANVIAVGPGLGCDAWAESLLHAALARDVPKVLDADALNLIADPGISINGTYVLTPHPAEAARLLGTSTVEIQRERFKAAQTIASKSGATCVLKGAGTVVSSRNETDVVVAGGNPGMAVAGMGDALTGIVAACLAQGMAPHSAAWVGTVWHAAVGDALAATEGTRGLRASALVDRLPSVMKG